MDKQKIRAFKRHVKSNPFTPIKKQECSIRKGTKKFWTADMWTVDVCDYLIDPQTDKFPNDYKFKGTTEYITWNTSIHKHNMYKELCKLKDESDSIIIGEVGRGVDILIAQMVKQWKLILCYDHVPYEPYLKLFFKGFEFTKTNTHDFLMTDKYIPEGNHILIINETKFRKWESINPNIKYIIFNGNIYP